MNSQPGPKSGIPSHIEDDKVLQDGETMKVDQRLRQDDLAGDQPDATDPSDSPSIAISTTTAWEKELLEVSKVVPTYSN